MKSGWSNKTSSLKDRSFVDYEAHIAQTFDRTPLERVNKEANIWPPPLVYGITPGPTSGDEMSVTTVKQPIPKKAQSPLDTWVYNRNTGRSSYKSNT